MTTGVSANGEVQSCRDPVDVAVEVLSYMNAGWFAYSGRDAKQWGDERRYVIEK